MNIRVNRVFLNSGYHPQLTHKLKSFFRCRLKSQLSSSLPSGFKSLGNTFHSLGKKFNSHGNQIFWETNPLGINFILTRIKSLGISTGDWKEWRHSPVSTLVSRLSGLGVKTTVETTLETKLVGSGDDTWHLAARELTLQCRLHSPAAKCHMSSPLPSH